MQLLRTPLNAGAAYTGRLVSDSGRRSDRRDGDRREYRPDAYFGDRDGPEQMARGWAWPPIMTSRAARSCAVARCRVAIGRDRRCAGQRRVSGEPRRAWGAIIGASERARGRRPRSPRPRINWPAFCITCLLIGSHMNHSTQRSMINAYGNANSPCSNARLNTWGLLSNLPLPKFVSEQRSGAKSKASALGEMLHFDFAATAA